jgi:hypothetical protein
MMTFPLVIIGTVPGLILFRSCKVLNYCNFHENVYSPDWDALDHKFVRICCCLIFLAGYNYLLWESGVMGRLHTYTLRKVTIIFFKKIVMGRL